MNAHKKSRNSFLEPRAFTLTEIAIVLGVVGSVLGAIYVAYAQVSMNKNVELASEEIRFIVNKVQSLYAVNPGAFTVPDTNLGCGVGKINCGCVSSLPSPAPACVPATVAQGACVAPCYQPYWCVQGSMNEFPANSGEISLNNYAVPAGIYPQAMITKAGTVSPPWGGVKADGSGVVNLYVQETSNACSIDNNAAAIAAFNAMTTPGQTTTVNVGKATQYYLLSPIFMIGFPNVPAAACIKLLMTQGTELTNLGLQAVSANAAIALPMTPAGIIAGCGTTASTMYFTFPLQRP